MSGTEKVKNNETGDWLECVCGNEPAYDGFEPCLPDGTVVEPVPGIWDGVFYICARCGRIINVDTLEVTGQATPPL